MYTSILLSALSGFFVSAAAVDTPSWQKDYAKAQLQSEREKKPLAIVIGTGKEGWKKLAQDGELSREAQNLLAAEYLCVYVDTASEKGKRLAADFEMTGLGLVLGDRTGKSQAFWHQGGLGNRELVRSLQKYAAPDLVVTSTESNRVERTSFYPSTEAGSYYPVSRGCASGH
jgi:hypothetical protein